jgi:D-arginine dehydrogenase
MTPTDVFISRARAIGQFGSARTTKFPATPATPHPKRSTSTAIARFEGVVDWPIERVERSWAGLRTFAPDRLPVYGFDPHVPSFFWCAGQGGFGIQTSPAAATMAAAQLLGEEPDATVAHIDPAVFSPARFA